MARINEPEIAGSTGAPSARTRVYALLGNPVAHSLSPEIQNAAFRAVGDDAVYVALRCDAEEVPGLIRGLARAGGGGNVTVPHKAVAAASVDVATDAVRHTQACNTFWLEDGRVHGDNTDVAGFREALRALIGDPAGARVLLLGAGGAARAAAYALLGENVDAVDIANRTPERARRLIAALEDDPRLRALPSGEPEGDARYDVIVNATSLGLRPNDPLPLDLTKLGRAGAALDIVYAPDTTPWVQHATALGVPAADGAEMLLQQGAVAFEHWTGRPAPLQAMRVALARSTRH